MSFMSSDFFVMLNDCCKNTGFYDLCSKLLSILFDIHLKNISLLSENIVIPVNARKVQLFEF